MPGQIQLLNDEQATLMSSRFPDRLEPNFAWGNVCSFYQALPVLHAFWPCGAQKRGPNDYYIQDIACNYNLTTVHNPLFGYEALRPYVDFDGANDYAYYLDDAQFDILGNAEIAAQPGLTLGCWIYPERAAATPEYILAKYDQAINLSSAYYIKRTGGGALEMSVTNGAIVTFAPSASLIRQNVWQFVAGKFIPSTSLTAYLSTAVGSLEATPTATAIATINNSAYNFTMASDRVPSNYFDGKISLAWICASALSDTMINALYQLSRPLFGQ